MPYCYVCPHRCGVYRPYSINDEEGIFGSCGCGLQPIAARAGLHMWEEPCISGIKGSGEVFFFWMQFILRFLSKLKNQQRQCWKGNHRKAFTGDLS